MKSGNRYDYKRFVEDYFAKVGSGSCPEGLYELKTLLACYSKRVKSCNPETFSLYLGALLIGGSEGERMQQEYKDDIEQDYSQRYGRYRLRRRLDPIFRELSEVYNFCQDKETGPIAKKHIKAMRAQWKGNEAALAAKYQIKERDHFISAANKCLAESKGSPDGSNPSQGHRSPENDGSQGPRVTWDLGE